MTEDEIKKMYKRHATFANDYIHFLYPPKFDHIVWKENNNKMNKKEIEFRDPVVERVVDKFVRRSDVGFEKYKVTLDEERTTGIKDLFKYLNDIQEELMDAVLYIQAAKEEISDLTEEALLRKFE